MTDRLQIDVGVDPQWAGPLKARLRDMGLGYDPVLAEAPALGPDRLLEALHHTGALNPDQAPVTWTLLPSADQRGRALSGVPLHAAAATEFAGAFLFEHEGTTFGAAQIQARPTVLVLAGPSLEALARMMAGVDAAHRAAHGGRLEVWGAESYAGRRRLSRDVAEDELILPDALKTELLSYADAFGRAAGGPDAGSASRGLLFLGRPGTGKTLAARHVLGRLPGLRKYLYIQAGSVGRFDQRTFEQMVQDLDTRAEPAVVVVEDIDRMFEGGSTTPQYFLNVLDGLLEPDAPVLWIATSNDPGDLADNLVDRPGRFDKVFLFPLPDHGLREQLFALHAAAPLDPGLAGSLAASADGLTGAHIREVCRSAVITMETDGLSYADALRAELERTAHRHRGSRDYTRALRGATAVGFERPQRSMSP